MQETSRNEHKGNITSDNTLDWRGRPSNPKLHGGMKAASFVLGIYFSLTCFEILIPSFMYILESLYYVFICYYDDMQESKLLK